MVYYYYYLFDILNSSVFRHGNAMKTALSSDSVALPLLNSLKEWISNWKVLNADRQDITKKFKCIQRWLQVIEGVQLIFKKVCVNDSFLHFSLADCAKILWKTFSASFGKQVV